MNFYNPVQEGRGTKVFSLDSSKFNYRRIFITVKRDSRNFKILIQPYLKTPKQDTPSTSQNHYIIKYKRPCLPF